MLMNIFTAYEKHLMPTLLSKNTVPIYTLSSLRVCHLLHAVTSYKYTRVFTEGSLIVVKSRRQVSGDQKRKKSRTHHGVSKASVLHPSSEEAGDTLLPPKAQPSEITQGGGILERS